MRHGDATAAATAANGAAPLRGAEQSNGVADRLLTADDLAERWQVRPAQVYRLTREGCLPVVKIGRYCRYRLSAIEAFEIDGGVGSDG